MADHDETDDLPILPKTMQAAKEIPPHVLRVVERERAQQRAQRAPRKAPSPGRSTMEEIRAEALQADITPRMPKRTTGGRFLPRTASTEGAPVPAPAAPAPVIEETPVANASPRYWVRWVNPASGVFKYFGVDYDHGQLVPLRPGPTYDKLLNIMYVAQVETPRLIAPCGVCGAEFLNERFLNAHGAKRHSDRFATADDLEVQASMRTEHGDAAAVDVTGDSLERRLMTEFPLALENTTASRNA